MQISESNFPTKLREIGSAGSDGTPGDSPSAFLFSCCFFNRLIYVEVVKDEKQHLWVWAALVLKISARFKLGILSNISCSSPLSRPLMGDFLDLILHVFSH